MFYIAAHYAQLIWPTDGQENYVAFDAGDRSPADGIGCRQIHGGTVYIMNQAGKTVDVLHLGHIAPKSDVKAPQIAA